MDFNHRKWWFYGNVPSKIVILCHWIIQTRGVLGLPQEKWRSKRKLTTIYLGSNHRCTFPIGWLLNRGGCFTPLTLGRLLYQTGPNLFTKRALLASNHEANWFLWIRYPKNQSFIQWLCSRAFFQMPFRGRNSRDTQMTKICGSRQLQLMNAFEHHVFWI